MNDSSINDCFEALLAGEADLMIQNRHVVEYWISKPAYEKLRVIPVLGLADELCFSAVFSSAGAVVTCLEVADAAASIADKERVSTAAAGIVGYNVEDVMPPLTRQHFQIPKNKRGESL